MAALGFVLFCLQAVFFNEVLSNVICANNVQNAASSRLSNLGASTATASLLSKASTTCVEPLTITSATFTPISSISANQAGLADAAISQVVPNLQFGDITLSGDLPIGGTIKVSGCFPVYGMVELDGSVPSTGTATAGSQVQFPAGLAAAGCVC